MKVYHNSSETFSIIYVNSFEILNSNLGISNNLYSKLLRIHGKNGDRNVRDVSLYIVKEIFAQLTPIWSIK